MIATLRSELLKQRTTRTTLGLFATLLALVIVAELIHGYGLAAERLDNEATQLFLLGPAGIMGTLLAGMLGAMSITGEFRHGTIRPTFLVTPHRIRVVAAKACATMFAGAGFGLAAGVTGAGVSAIALSTRDIPLHLTAGDYVLPFAGGAAAGALWSALGVGLGALIRNQVATLIALSAWLLFVENLLVGDLANLDIYRYLPGGTAAAISGQEPETALLTPAIALALLAGYAAIATIAGAVATNQRDVA